MYVFFAASTHRYEVLSNAIKSADRSVCVPKRINTTRWSCRADASKAFVQGYPEIKNALAEFADNPNDERCRTSLSIFYIIPVVLPRGLHSPKSGTDEKTHRKANYNLGSVKIVEVSGGGRTLE